MISGKTKVAVIGLGGAGKAHLGYFKQTGMVEIVGLMDPRGDSLNHVVAEAGLSHLKVLTNYSDLLAIPTLEAVSICSPDATHCDYAVRALDAGMHVLCEKPVIAKAEEGELLIEAVRRSGKVFASFHQLRFYKPYDTAKRIVDSGEIGEVYCVEGDYIHSLKERAGANDTWRLKEPYGQPPQLGGGIHFTDLFLWILNDDLREQYSYANNISFPRYPETDCVISIMQFKRGAVGRVITAFGAAMPQNFKVRIYGTKGSIIENMVFIGERFDRFTHVPKGGPKQRLITALIRRFPLPSFRDFPYYSYDHGPPCIETVRDFLNAVRTGSTPRANVIAGVKAAIASIQQTDAYRYGRPVSGSEVIE
jgi:predicted dehydrogenase